MSEKIATYLSCFKRDFLGAPIWKAMNALKESTRLIETNSLLILEKKIDPPIRCQIDYRPEESYWVNARDVS